MRIIIVQWTDGEWWRTWNPLNYTIVFSSRFLRRKWVNEIETNDSSRTSRYFYVIHKMLLSVTVCVCVSLRECLSIVLAIDIRSWIPMEWMKNESTFHHVKLLLLFALLMESPGFDMFWFENQPRYPLFGYCLFV